jgi:hypothetical protein
MYFLQFSNYTSPISSAQGNDRLVDNVHTECPGKAESPVGGGSWRNVYSSLDKDRTSVKEVDICEKRIQNRQLDSYNTVLIVLTANSLSDLGQYISVLSISLLLRKIKESGFVTSQLSLHRSHLQMFLW